MLNLPCKERKFDVILEQLPSAEKSLSPRAILSSLTCNGQESTTPAILLKPNTTLNAEEFERLWKSMEMT